MMEEVLHALIFVIDLILEPFSLSRGEPKSRFIRAIVLALAIVGVVAVIVITLTFLTPLL